MPGPSARGPTIRSGRSGASGSTTVVGVLLARKGGCTSAIARDLPRRTRKKITAAAISTTPTTAKIFFERAAPGTQIVLCKVSRGDT
jgi:hypothetical protein